MFVMKLSAFNLYARQWDWTWGTECTSGQYIHRPILPGQKVCSCQRLENLGIVTHVGTEVDVFQPYQRDSWQHSRAFTREVTVLWLTGPKKGKTETKHTKLLVDFTAYKEAVVEHLKEIEAIESEGAKTGL